jgi:hypothetical protein
VPLSSVRRLLPRRFRPAPELPPFWQQVSAAASTPAIITSRAIKQQYADTVAAIMGERNDNFERDLVYAPGWRDALRWLEDRAAQQRNDAAAREEWPWPTYDSHPDDQLREMRRQNPEWYDTTVPAPAGR